MKKKSKLVLKYIEGIIYCIVLIISVMLYITGNTYIKMIPIAFITGMIGQMLLRKKAMTSIFSCIISIVLFQVRTPSLLYENIVSTVVITVLSLVGELCGYSLKKLIHLLKLRNTKRREKEKVKHYIVCCITVIIGVVINSVINGNIISYFRCRNNLKEYFISEYMSSSRFKVFASKYSLGNNANYVFYTKDSLNRDEIGQFIVYLDDTQTIQDEYKTKIIKEVINNISNSLQDIEEMPQTNITITNEPTNEITLNFIKEVEQINEKIVDEYVVQIANYIEQAKKIEEFGNVKQIKIVLESSQDSRDSLATYIYIDGYNEMLESGQEAYEYIKRALSIEYLY